MPFKIRGRSKFKNSEEPSQNGANNDADGIKASQKSKTLRWRIFPFSRRSVDNSSPASHPGDISSSANESGGILEEEYQESFGLGSGDHSESVPSILRKITPPRLSDPPPASATFSTVRHSSYAPHRFGSVSTTTTTTISNGNGIYNEPCDARRSRGSGTVKKIPSLRRASLAASIYCDAEHHRKEGFPQPPSPQGSPDSLRLNHLRETSSSSALTVNSNGIKNGTNSHTPSQWKDHDSGSSSLSNSRDVSSHNNSRLEMASPPIGTGSPSGHSPLARIGGSVRVRSQSPPPPRTSTTLHQQPLQNHYTPSTPQTQLLAKDRRCRQQPGQHNPPSTSPAVERRHRNLSPRQRTATPSSSASPALSNSPSLSNGPVVLQGNTQISHHPASPFAPIPRTTPHATLISSGGGDHRAVSPTFIGVVSSVRSQSDVTAPASAHYPHLQHVQRNSTASPSSVSPSQSQNPQTLFSSGAGPDPRQASDYENNPSGPRASRRRRDLVATYEEAWDVKMSRRLGGMDVSRLAEALPNCERKFPRNDLTRASDRPIRSTPVTAVGVHRAPSLSPVLTSTEGVIMRPKATPRVPTYRNSSNETVCNRELMVSPFRLKQNRVASPTLNMMASPRPGECASPAHSDAPVTDYDYAYNRSWSMGVQLNLSLNLASNTHASTDQTLDEIRGSKPSSPISGNSSPPPPPPHKSTLTPTLTQFSPPQSPTPMRRHRHDGPSSPVTGCGSSSPSLVHQPAVSRSGVRSRGVHNPLASGVTVVPSSISPHSPSDGSTIKGGDTSDASATPSGTVSNPGLHPHMPRLLTDWDNMSTDSCEEPWDIRQGKVISQLTSSRFIDPSEVLLAVVNGNHSGANGNDSNVYANGHGGLVEGEGNGNGAAVPPALGISPPVSCRSPLARSPSNIKSTQIQNLKPLSKQPWFHPNLTRVGAEKKLRSEPEGSFLVRNSETNKNEFSLTVKQNGFLHMRITRDAQGQFVLGEYSQPYPSIPHMISHYEQTQVPVKGADSVTLCHPR